MLKQNMPGVGGAPSSWTISPITRRSASVVPNWDETPPRRADLDHTKGASQSEVWRFIRRMVPPTQFGDVTPRAAVLQTPSRRNSKLGSWFHELSSTNGNCWYHMIYTAPVDGMCDLFQAFEPDTGQPKERLVIPSSAQASVIALSPDNGQQ